MTGQTGTVYTSDIELVVSGIDSILNDSGGNEQTLRQLSQDITHLCNTHPCTTSDSGSALNVTRATTDISSAIDDCKQTLAAINTTKDAGDDASQTPPTESAVNELKSNAQRLQHTLEDSMTQSFGIQAEADVAAPPSYEAATTTTEGESGSSRPQTFVPYSDEKSQLAVPDEPAASGSRQRSYSRGSVSEPVSRIAPSIPPGSAVIQAKFFYGKSQPRLALSTSGLLQVYDAARDSLLWELHGNSGQLIQGNEEPFSFSSSLVPSPDGSTLCIIVYREKQRRLLVIDAESGWVRLEHLLATTGGTNLAISTDNSKAALCHHNNDTGKASQFKIFSLVEGQGASRMRHVPHQKPEFWHGLGVQFTPDGQHIIICAGPSKNPKDRQSSITVSVYNEATGDLVRSTRPPGSPAKPTSSPSFTPGFHFPSVDEWLVSFPDPQSPEKTYIMNARLGQTVAVFSAELSFSQKWQVGVQSAEMVQVAYDEESGIFTKMEVVATLLPRGKTVTITHFALSANGGREKAVLRKAYQIRSKVLRCKQAGVCGLSPVGSHVFAQQGSAGKVDIFTVAL